jgi:hypothetical protein
MVIQLAERLVVALDNFCKQSRVNRRRGASCGCIHRSDGQQGRKESPHIRHNYIIYGQKRQKDLLLCLGVLISFSDGCEWLLKVLQ